MEKVRNVEVIEDKEVRGDTSCLPGVKVPFESQRGKWQLKSCTKKRFLKERRSWLCYPSKLIQKRNHKRQEIRATKSVVRRWPLHSQRR